MTIERTKDEIIIRLPSTMNIKMVESIIDYYKLMDNISKNKGKEKDAIKLAREVNKAWWEKNRSRFIK